MWEVRARFTLPATGEEYVKVMWVTTNQKHAEAYVRALQSHQMRVEVVKVSR